MSDYREILKCWPYVLEFLFTLALIYCIIYFGYIALKPKDRYINDEVKMKEYKKKFGIK